MRRPAWTTLAAAAVLALAACNSGPKGPGSLGVTVSGAKLGAVVLEASGTGIRGFQGRGGTKVYSNQIGPVTGAPTELLYRVVVVGPDAGNLQFAIRVNDVAGPKPTISVVDAVDGQNQTLGGGNLHVSITR